MPDRDRENKPGNVETDAHGNSWSSGLEMRLNDGTEIRLADADLASPERLRARWYEATGWELPHHSMEDHTRLVVLLFQLAGYVDAQVRPA